MKLKLGELGVDLDPRDLALRFVAHGGSLRGVLGKALREISCTEQGRVCAECPQNTRCAYGYLFETPVPNDSEVLRRYPRAPHPLLLRPPVPATNLAPALPLTVVLVERATNHFVHVFVALERMGRLGLGASRTPFTIRRIWALRDEMEIVGAEASGPVRLPTGHAYEIGPGEAEHGQLRLLFLTPLRLRTEERIVRTPEFAPIVSAALRRLELLYRVHSLSDEPWSVCAKELVEAARDVRLVDHQTRWHDASRYSRRQGAEHPLGGMVGWAEYEGDIGTFRPILEVAGRTHIGKQTSFGNGYVQVENV